MRLHSDTNMYQLRSWQYWIKLNQSDAISAPLLKSENLLKLIFKVLWEKTKSKGKLGFNWTKRRSSTNKLFHHAKLFLVNLISILLFFELLFDYFFLKVIMFKIVVYIPSVPVMYRRCIYRLLNILSLIDFCLLSLQSPLSNEEPLYLWTKFRIPAPFSLLSWKQKRKF